MTEDATDYGIPAGFTPWGDSPMPIVALAGGDHWGRVVATTDDGQSYWVYFGALDGHVIAHEVRHDDLVVVGRDDRHPWTGELDTPI